MTTCRVTSSVDHNVCNLHRDHAGWHYDEFTTVSWWEATITVTNTPHLELEGMELLNHLVNDHWANGEAFPSGAVISLRAAHSRMGHER